jgi:beta-glucosidase
LDELVSSSIEPLVTLYHWDLPQSLEERYSGWLSPSVGGDFLRFADLCFRLFGDRVKKWITLNEPWTSCTMGYELGLFAPGRCSDRARCPQGDSPTESYLAAHNMLNAHAAVVQLYRDEYQQSQRGVIGITLNLDWAEPLTDSLLDAQAAQVRNEFALGWFSDPIVFGRYPASMEMLVGDRLPRFTEEQRVRITGSFDFIGLNHYTSKYYSKSQAEFDLSTHKSEGWTEDQQTVQSKYDVLGNIIGLQGDSVWLNMVPWGFYKVIMWTHNRYKDAESVLQKQKNSNAVGPLIYITENGCDVPGESELPLQAALNDTFRFFSFYI